ncbi:hypothetical protein QCA50_010668 [Cerrena zonata]|uniref:Uncharacterized protein n=1 Tax=Cerrena zonata TaxID=2478898 RepID=A0AAW0G428_9APHY
MALMKHTLLFFALAALLTFTLALPLSPLVSPELIGRAGPASSKCNGIKAANGLGQCNACVATTGCIFDRTISLCVQAPTGRLDTNRFVTQKDANQCKTIAQGLKVEFLFMFCIYSEKLISCCRPNPPLQRRKLLKRSKPPWRNLTRQGVKLKRNLKG